jgi:hypothetical protein
VSANFRSKEELVRGVWGYDVYHPERHDGVLHGSLARIRKLLGEFSSWIEASELGYRLNPGVRVLEQKDSARRNSPEPVKQKPQPSLPALLKTDSVWNLRQYQALRLMEQGTVLGVTEYTRRFQISKITASRDLGGLHAAGAVRKFGRARATQYGLI